ncbi:putative acylphosphatase [Magnetofaba australis IT-1]|uniref:acylphosphatase n=1 Tax=Magnetofaba australis IT-1 TaxID=1434232 RepID=A0A1Y2K627_9PROT|nr:putative acylphosphatase [Magnetofaba australis IT-1]
MQGVWYRGATQQQAQKLGLRGWVRNEPDGSVRALVIGPPAQVDALAQWCWQGPPMARVQDVIVSLAAMPTNPPTEFRVAR